MASKKLSSIVGGGSSVFPTIEADLTHNGLGIGAVDAEDQEGFDGDGDYISLPSTAAGSIDYFNNAGVSQSGWPITIANISAAHTTWLGFDFDATDNLLYVCTRGATLTNFIFSSINQAGTIVNIATVTVTEPDAGSQWNWGVASPGATGSCNFVRVADGSGNFTMFITSNPIDFLEEIEFTVAGALIQDTIRTVDFENTAPVHYKTPNGNYIGEFDPDADLDKVVVGVASGTSSKSKFTSLTLPQETGIFWLSNSGGYPTLWKGKIALVFFQNTRGGPKYYKQSVFNTFVDELNAAGGTSA
jgi:hypothetical protein